MPISAQQVDRLHVIALLRGWLAGRVEPGAARWLDHARGLLLDGAPDRVFFAAYGDVPRHVGDERLRLDAADRQEATAARKGWYPNTWTTSEAARALLLLSYDDSDPEAFGDMAATLLKNANVGGMVAFMRSLPLLPYPERHRTRAVLATRSERQALLEAVALYNPYPAERFDEGEWNQMVIKALFLGCPLYAISGLDHRANHPLAHMAMDFIRSRREAGQPVSPEALRLIGPHVDGRIVTELERLLTDGDAAWREAAALALARNDNPHASAVLEKAGDLHRSIEDGHLTWDGFTRRRLVA